MSREGPGRRMGHWHSCHPVDCAAERNPKTPLAAVACLRRRLPHPPLPEPGRPPPAAEIWRDQLSLHQSQQGQCALVIPSPWHTCRRYRRPGQAGLHQRCSSRVVARSGGLVGGRVDRLIGWRNGGWRNARGGGPWEGARASPRIFLLRDHATFLTFKLFATLTVQDHNPFLAVDARGEHGMDLPIFQVCHRA